METFSALLVLCAGNSPSPVNSPHKGQWRGALMLLWSALWINGWVNNREAGDLRHHSAHYDVIVMNNNQVTQRWRILVNKSYESAKKYNITKTKTTHNKTICVLCDVCISTTGLISGGWVNTQRGLYGSLENPQPFNNFPKDNILTKYIWLVPGCI